LHARLPTFKQSNCGVADLDAANNFTATDLEMGSKIASLHRQPNCVVVDSEIGSQKLCRC